MGSGRINELDRSSKRGVMLSIEWAQKPPNCMKTYIVYDFLYTSTSACSSVASSSALVAAVRIIVDAEGPYPG